MARAVQIAQRAGDARARAAAAKLAAAIERDVRGVTVTIEDGGVAISGRGLGQRRLNDPRLRWLGGLLR